MYILPFCETVVKYGYFIQISKYYKKAYIEAS